MYWQYNDTTGAEQRAEYYLTNHQGSVVATASATTGERVNLYTYDAYGTLGNLATQGGSQPFRYTGRRWDDETGLYYYRARYYHASLGRFLQTDPIGYEDNMNLYGYTNNDPVNGRDPFGLDNCPNDDKNCIETPESDGKPGTSPEKSEEVKELEEIVITAKRIKRKKFRLGSGKETTWKLSKSKGLKERKTKWRELNCGGGNTVTLGVMAPLQAGEAQLHSHSSEHEATPGPGDGGAARASTTGAAFLVTPDNVFTIEAFGDGSFRTTVVEGEALSDENRAALVANMQNWESPRASNKSLSYKQRFCAK